MTENANLTNQIKEYLFKIAFGVGIPFVVYLFVHYVLYNYW